ncbi:MAG: hypothetical protein HKP61_12155 [Dactylosporangium sp.]|nr:hypothetical protein [Dactylosporangium sp.]
MIATMSLVSIGLTTGIAAAPAHAANGCPLGYVCIYSPEGWDRNSPENVYYRYDLYPLYNQYGDHVIFNNQTGGARVSLCERNDYCSFGTNKTTPFHYNLTPFNYIWVSSV